jgi:chorismate mutase
MLRAILIAGLLIGVSAPAVAWQTCETPDAVNTRLDEVFPDRETITEFEPEMVDNLIKTRVDDLATALRTYIVFTRPGWTNVRIIAFHNGCVEDWLDVGSADFMALMGQGAKL